MSITVRTGAGTTLAVSSSLPATYDDTGFQALTYTTVGEVTGLPDHGAEYTLVTHNPIASRVTQKRKGSVNYGSMSLPMALDDFDGGQTILQTHADGANVDSSASFKITYNGGGVEYFTAQVMSFQRAVSDVDSMISGTVMLEIDSVTVYVADTTT